MPNKNTFSIKPIGDLILRYIGSDLVGLDPFAKQSKVASITNDLDDTCGTDYNLDAMDFLKLFDSNSQDYVLFDPPYSPRQVSEVYKKFDRTVNMQTTQSSFWGNLKKEISRVVKPGGTVITCGWCSNGIGKTNGFEIVEILMVAHGGWHNETIITVEKKMRGAE